MLRPRCTLVRLHYYRDRLGNFGDDLNGWLWERLLPGCWDAADGVVMTGIGTILDNRIPDAKAWIIFSSGVGYYPLPERFGGPEWHVVSVRGPLSARVLGLASDKALVDGAILLSL